MLRERRAVWVRCRTGRLSSGLTPIRVNCWTCAVAAAASGTTRSQLRSLAVQTSLSSIPCRLEPRGFMLDLDGHLLMQRHFGKQRRGSQWIVGALLCLRSGKRVEAFEGSAGR